MCTVIGAVLDVEGAAVTAEGVPPFPPAVEVAMLPAVAMVEDGSALAIVAFVVLDAAVLLSGAVEGVAAAVAVGGVAVAVDGVAVAVAAFATRALRALVALDDFLIFNVV